MARSLRSGKKIRLLVELVGFVLPTWRTTSNTIVDPAGRHTAYSQFPGCKAARLLQDRHFHLSAATCLEGNLPGENESESPAECGVIEHFVQAKSSASPTSGERQAVGLCSPEVGVRTFV